MILEEIVVLPHHQREYFVSSIRWIVGVRTTTTANGHHQSGVAIEFEGSVTHSEKYRLQAILGHQGWSNESYEHDHALSVKQENK